jgi:hypothetical protein
MTYPGSLKTGLGGLVVGGLALLLAACGSSPNSGVASLGNPKTTTTAQSNAPAGTGTGKKAGYGEMLEYSQCVRSHGVPGFPDPSSSPNGGYGFKITPSEHIAQGSTQFQAAQQACRKLLSNGGETTPAEHAEALAEAHRAAASTSLSIRAAVSTRARPSSRRHRMPCKS